MSNPIPSDSFEAVLQAPEIIFDPGAKYAASTRKFQGISSLACGRNGRLWATWYGGITPGEDHNNYVMLAISADVGRTWSDEILVIDPDGEGPVRDFDPEVWLAPDGKLWLFWAQGYSHEKTTSSRSGVWAITATESEAVNAKWSEPRRLCDGVMMCKPIILSSGAWALPVSFWHRREQGSAGIVVSTDQGQTWQERGAVSVPPIYRNHDEHMMVERQDGSLWMLVRTNYGIGESVSRDLGYSWSLLQPCSIPHVRSRFFIRRLASGRLLLVRHDPADAAYAGMQSQGRRSHLTAFLSEDDGQSWPWWLLLDERLGVSYPDGDQADDGTIHITYDFDRTGAREILLATCTEDDIVQGNMHLQTVRLRTVVNKATG